MPEELAAWLLLVWAGWVGKAGGDKGAGPLSDDASVHLHVHNRCSRQVTWLGLLAWWLPQVKGCGPGACCGIVAGAPRARNTKQPEQLPSAGSTHT